MATGGFKSNSATDFLEEWKAKREKMRAKLLGDIAAATGRTTELNNNGSPVNCVSSPSTYPVARSASLTALRRPEDEPKTSEAPGGSLKKTPEKVSVSPQTDASSPVGVEDSDKDSPSQGKSKEKRSTGPSARKGKGQIEKRKLREKRRSTGVVSIPSNEVSQLLLVLSDVFFCIVLPSLYIHVFTEVLRNTSMLVSKIMFAWQSTMVFCIHDVQASWHITFAYVHTNCNVE